jgi:hypothetical protein
MDREVAPDHVQWVAAGAELGIEGPIGLPPTLARVHRLAGHEVDDGYDLHGKARCGALLARAYAAADFGTEGDVMIATLVKEFTDGRP